MMIIGIGIPTSQSNIPFITSSFRCGKLYHIHVS